METNKQNQAIISSICNAHLNQLISGLDDVIEDITTLAYNVAFVQRKAESLKERLKEE